MAVHLVEAAATARAAYAGLCTRFMLMNQLSIPSTLTLCFRHAEGSSAQAACQRAPPQPSGCLARLGGCAQCRSVTPRIHSFAELGKVPGS